MRRHNHHTIEMTPLLDVVFILLFALMLNVNVSKARDEAEIEVLEAENEQLIASEAYLENKLEESTMSESQFMERLEQAKVDLSKLEEKSMDQITMLEDIQAQLDLLEESEGIEVEEWLKYEQIVDRYLFVEISIESEDGRVYIGEDYSGVNILAQDIVDKAVKAEKKEDLAGSLYDWLDHKDGGYSFVFITVVAQSDVKRATTELIFDTLSVMQPKFDSEQFMINSYITYN